MADDTRGRFDWEALRRRLDAAAGEGEGEGHDAAAEAAVLEARALALARPATAEGGDAMALPGLVFRRGREGFAVPLDDLAEVRRGAGVTILGGAPPPVVGIVGWRGRVLTVIDVAAEPSPPREEGALLVVGSPRLRVAIVADEVEEVVDVGGERLLPAPPGGSARGEIARGVTADAVLVLDVAALLRAIGSRT
jgi:chemotaxis signal transduction protein